MPTLNSFIMLPPMICCLVLLAQTLELVDE